MSYSRGWQYRQINVWEQPCRLLWVLSTDNVSVRCELIALQLHYSYSCILV